MTCRRCGNAANPGVTPYWARDGHRLCLPCAAAIAAKLDEADRWPPVPWNEADEEVLK